MFKKIVNKITKKIVSCPSCSKRMRVPIRANKTLLVDCPGCYGKFHIQFKTPFGGLPKWQKNRGFKYNLKTWMLHWNSFPFSQKLILIITVWMILTVLINLFQTNQDNIKEEVTPFDRPAVRVI